MTAPTTPNTPSMGWAREDANGRARMLGGVLLVVLLALTFTVGFLAGRLVQAVIS